MHYEQWMNELSKNPLPPMKKEKATVFDEIDKVMYGDLDEEEFFSIKDRESLNNTKYKKSSG
jgi:hypothetical protein